MWSLRTLGPVAAAVATLMTTDARAQSGTQNGRSSDDGAVVRPAVTAAVRQVLVTSMTAFDLDGRPDEAAWEEAVWSSGFVQREPVEGQPATQRTLVAVTQDAEALYVAARLLSTGSAVRAQVTRRDVESGSEQFIVSLDPYRDGRTAVSFGVTAAGVRLDYYHPSDQRSSRDYSYDPVWEARIARTDEGWTAELRIPFSQLRFDPRSGIEWGVNFARIVPALNEESYWVLVPKDETGWSSRFAPLAGVSPRATGGLEVLPYVSTSAHLTPDRAAGNPFDDGRNLEAVGGADVRLRLSSNFTLEGTVNPDFGQVELDPAEVNLGVFESTFAERRPFFMEGRQLLSGGGAQYFYSRRVGAPPRLGANAPSGAFVDQPAHTTILGAAKLTGRTSNGLAVGALAAVTDEEHARSYDPAESRSASELVQPRTAFAVARVRQEFGDGGSTGGAILTAVGRRLPSDAARLRAVLPRGAVTGGTDWVLRFRDGEYEATFDAGFSHVVGDSAAMIGLQRSSARYYQRPDARYVEVDSARQSLTGYRAGAGLARRSGRHWLWNVRANAVSPGFDLNDAGLLFSADRIAGAAQLRYRENAPKALVRLLHSYYVNLDVFRTWAFDGLTVGAEQPGLFANVTFRNFWRLAGHFHSTPTTHSTTATRGGPAARMPANRHYYLDLFGNPGRRLRWDLSWNLFTDEIGKSNLLLYGTLGYNSQGRWSLSATPSYSDTEGQRQYVTQSAGGSAETYGRRYVFASLDRKEIAVRFRAHYSATPDLSLEIFAQPFVSTGRYSAFGELRDPDNLGLLRYGTSGTSLDADGGSYTVTDAGGSFTFANPDFTVASLRSNAVLRWEWRRGSTLYAVWQQNRSARDPFVKDSHRQAFDDLLGVSGEHRFTVKMSYWLGL